MRALKLASVIVSMSLLIGCTTLTPQQKTEYTVMEKNSVLVKESTALSGAWLGLLPGGGYFY